MKPAPFAYAAPRSLPEAIALLAAHGGEARPIAGGQSLVPMLNFRLSAPALLVDLRHVPGLDHIALEPDVVRLGARVRWRDIDEHPRMRAAHPLLHEAVRHIGHWQIRNRGTVGGSLAHADPAAELPGIAVTCDGQIAATGPAGSRLIPAADFFLGPLTTALAADELITELRLPAWPRERRFAFLEFSRRQGDFALAGIALHWDNDAAGRARDVRIGAIGVGSIPLRLRAAEAELEGSLPDEAAFTRAANAAALDINPADDPHAGPEYRRALVATLTTRALRRAAGMPA